MMTKAAILQCIKDMESKEEEANGLSEIFATLRVAWTIPPDVKPDMPLEELQKAMVEGLPENWASRELLRMREE